MNFLLYMLGRSRLFPGARPNGRDALIGAAATAGGAGRFSEALDAYQKIVASPRCAAIDLLIGGHLHVALQNADHARDCFARGMGRLLESAGPIQEQSRVERLIADSGAQLKDNHFDQAMHTISRARALIDLLLSAEAGLVLSQGEVGVDAFAALVRLSDLTLKMAARAELARELAGALRRRRLNSELAAWATSDQSVAHLLHREYARLDALAEQTPMHAETLYRLALVARASGRLAEAADAFARTLALHPHHMSSAVRLAATRLELTPHANCTGMLHHAMNVPPHTMQLFSDLAAAAADPRFDASAEIFSAVATDSQTARANLAFALSELGMLDPSRELSREPAQQPV